MKNERKTETVPVLRKKTYNRTMEKRWDYVYG
nr:MAG TPA: hypothetical protein [Bacteriophage sp.]